MLVVVPKLFVAWVGSAPLLVLLAAQALLLLLFPLPLWASMLRVLLQSRVVEADELGEALLHSLEFLYDEIVCKNYNFL